jgi:hypothetical protein
MSSRVRRTILIAIKTPALCHFQEADIGDTEVRHHSGAGAA